MTDTIRAPWTPEQVAALNQFQQQGGMHPFTCGGEHSFSSPTLVAHPDGWHCPAEPCTYQQDWAHAFMADPTVWPRRFSERHGPTPEEAHVLIASATQPTPDPVTALLAHLEAEQAKAQHTADEAGRRPADDRTAVEALYAASGMVCGLRTAAILTVGHLRGAAARDAYIAATERADSARTTPDNPMASSVALANDSICDSYVPPTEWSESGICARCGMYDWKHTSEVDQLRAEVQRDRDQHAAVLREVLGRFRAGDGGAPEAWATREDLDRWRSVVAPTVERPWWEQVREWEEAAVDATHHVLELKATIERVRTECQAIAHQVYGQHDEDDDGMREAVGRVIAALDGAAS